MQIEGFVLPVSIIEDINSLEGRKFIITELIDGHNAKCELEKAKITIREQNAQIAALMTKVDDLQQALDTVLHKKYRTRKVTVKVYGRCPVDKTLHRYVRQAED